MITQLFIYRRPRRNTMKAFAKMLLNYGRGRAEQQCAAASNVWVLPRQFCSATVLRLFGGAGSFCFGLPSPVIKWRIYLPLLVTADSLRGRVAVAGQRRSLCQGRESFVSILRRSPFIALTHILYGVGFLLARIIHFV